MRMLTQMLLYTHQYIHILSNSVLQLENLKWIHDPLAIINIASGEQLILACHHPFIMWSLDYIHAVVCSNLRYQSFLCVFFSAFITGSPNRSSSHTSAVGWNLTVLTATQLNGNSCDVLWVNHLPSPLRLDPEMSAVCRQWWLWDHPLQWRGVFQLFRRRRPS